jgi:hypothetical protein
LLKNAIRFPVLPFFAALLYPNFAMSTKQNLMTKAYLEITLKINDSNRASAAGVYQQYKALFLKNIQGAVSKELLVHPENVQVLHGFASAEQAQKYLTSELFNNDVVAALKPYLAAEPDIKIYQVT